MRRAVWLAAFCSCLTLRGWAQENPPAGDSAGPATPEELDQRVRILERKLELEGEKNDALAKSQGQAVASKDGFEIKSADGAFRLKLRGYLQTDGRFFLDDEKLPATDSWVIRRARPVVEGTLFKFVDWKIMPDFGGGTTDFSILRFDVGGQGFSATPLAHGGVGIAGDRFDFHIIDRLVLPHLGKGGKYQGMGKALDLPVGVFMSFARWNMLSVLKSSDEFRDLKNMLKVCLEPEKIERMIELVEEDQGYPLYKAVSEAKMRLSKTEETEFAFAPLGADFRVRIKRADFESWISGDLARIEAALAQTLASAGLTEKRIDRVVLTGGTSFVPAVREIFDRRFGAKKIESGDELLSIASGLALIGERDDAAVWATGD